MLQRGIKSCEPSSIKKHLDELTLLDNNQAMCLLTNILKTYKTCTLKKKKVICYFADILQYNKPTLHGYIHGQEPNVIDSYLKDFAGKNKIIKETIKVSCCSGVTSGNSHHFIKAESSLQCSYCSNVTYQFFRIAF